MKIIVSAILIIGILVGFGIFRFLPQPSEPDAPAQYVGESIEGTQEADTLESTPAVAVIAENLTVPWEILFLPDGELFVTERPGRVLLLKAGIELEIPEVKTGGEGGLLGAALHPNFAENKYLYLYHTLENEAGVQNRVARYTLTGSELVFDREIVGNLPGARYHDGGRIVFGQDGFLYVTIGDALDEAAAQNPDSLEGTLIRVTDEGMPAPGNPFGSLVYSYGHRNAQGLAWDTAGNIWSTEHGRSGPYSGFDELNLITSGGNYGWPDSQGDTVAAGTVAPVMHSTADTTWAPGGLAYLDGSLYIPGLRGATLYEAVLEGADIVAWHEHFVGEYGRLRTVQVGPDGLLYVLTSNRDGRGDSVAENDDRLLRIDPTQLVRK